MGLKVEVSCDSCKKVFGTGTGKAAIEDLVRRLQEAGWLVDHEGKIICPLCLQWVSFGKQAEENLP